MHAVLLGLAFLSATAVFAQAGEATRKNEIGLVIGATEMPSIATTAGGTINLNSSLALGASTIDGYLVNAQLSMWASTFSRRLQT
jgi:hypothetical protein